MIRFSIRTLLIVVALVAVGISASFAAHRIYCQNKMMRYATGHHNCGVSDLLRYGKSCGFSPKWAEPTLAYAAETGNLLALSPFTHEFDINHRIGGNQTALMISAANGRFDAVKMLIDHGADSAMRDNKNSTAADLAARADHSTVASLLQHHRSTNWELIKKTESMVKELRRDSTNGEISEYESLLGTKKFATLNSSRIDCNLRPSELVWFRVTDNCSIGIDDSGSLIWMIDDVRAVHEW